MFIGSLQIKVVLCLHVCLLDCVGLIRGSAQLCIWKTPDLGHCYKIIAFCNLEIFCPILSFFFFFNYLLHNSQLPWLIKIMISLTFFFLLLIWHILLCDCIYKSLFLKNIFLFCKFHLLSMCPLGFRGYVQVIKFELLSVFSCLGQQYDFMAMFGNIPITDL